MWWFVIVTAGYLAALGAIWWATPQAPELARRASPLASILMVWQLGFNTGLVFLVDITPPLLILITYLIGQGLIIASAIIGAWLLARAGRIERVLLVKLFTMKDTVSDIRDEAKR